MRRLAPVSVLALLTLLAVACGGGDEGDALHVFAASSLSEAFTALGAGFERQHPGVDVAFNFAGSSALAQQIVQGAPADVFAAADEVTMDAVVAGGHATAPVVVARNRLSLLVEKGNPLGISGLGDLARPGLRWVMCAPQVPCGRFAQVALSRAGIAADPAALEENVKGVVTRVTLGEADAGIVYATDVRAAAGRAEGVVIDGADAPDLEAAYPMAVVRASSNPEAARAWVAYVRSAAGRAVLTRFGFLPP